MRFLLASLLALVGTTYAGKGKVPGMHYLEVPESLQGPADPMLFHSLSLTPNAPASELSLKCSANITGTNTNGTCHNLVYPLLGLSNQIEIVYGEARYADGEQEPVEEERPEPRDVSNMACSNPTVDDRNIKGATRILIFLGQFIDHDFALSLEDEEEIENIAVPNNDNTFGGRRELFFSRSINCRIPRFFPGEDLDDDGETLNVRNFMSVNTPWLDLGSVYGDTPELTMRLRNFTGGLLNTSLVLGREFPPQNGMGMSICGDIRCEENVMLFSFHTLFLREHNRIARAYANFTGIRNDEQLFQAARVRNIMQYQSLIWDFYLPYLLGRRTFFELTRNYADFGHQVGVDPTVSVMFTTAVYRYGHSGVSNDLQFTQPDGTQVRNTIALRDAFLTNSPVRDATPGSERNLPAIFVGQSRVPHARLEQRVVDGIRNTLFGLRLPFPSPMSQSDLISRNIARSRDHGLQGINYYRQLFGLRTYECEEDPIQCFISLTGEATDSRILFDLYGEIDEVDLWVAGMAEFPFEDSLLGELFTVVMAEQFQRMRLGDRIWYENILSDIPNLDQEVAQGVVAKFPVRLADIIRANGQDLPGIENFELEFIVNNVYTAFAAEDAFQIEWALPDSIRLSTNQVTSFDVFVSGPNWANTFNVMGDDMLWLLVDNELLSGLTVPQTVRPGADYTVTVTANLRNAAGQPITPQRIDPQIVITTLEEGTRLGALAEEGEGEGEGEEGEGEGVALSGGAVAGIVIGCVAGVGIIGAGVYAATRGPSYKNDDFNAAFF